MVRKAKYVILAVAIFSLIGCSAEHGAREGVEAGIAAAIATLIEAPVDAWAAATFGT